MVYFAPDFTEVATIARARALLDRGFRPAVFAFRRSRYNHRFQAGWPEVDLGRTEDGRYAKRLVALIRALPKLWRHRRLLRDATVLYARNLDQLGLALAARLFCRGPVAIVYEVLDIAPGLTNRGRLGRIMRSVERRLLRKVSLLAVSSPGFIRNFYGPVQGYRGPTFLIENKLYRATPTAHAAAPPRSIVEARRRYRWVVGYYGLLRGEENFELITRLAQRLSGQVLFYFRGVTTTVDAARFQETIRRHDNMLYDGPYENPDDLAEIYGAIDFAWTIDLERSDSNARWLMPCRFYEAGAFGVPLLAARHFEVGDRVEALGVGWTFGPPYEDEMADFFARLTRADYERVLRRYAEVPRSTFVDGDDATELCRALARQSGQAA